MNQTTDKKLQDKHQKETQKQMAVFIVFNLVILVIAMGRKPKDDYYTAYTKVQENPVPNYVIITSTMFTILILLISIFINVVAYQG